MASISNLMVTPPTKDEKKRFIDFSDCNSPDSLHSKTLTSKLQPKWYSSLCKFHRDRVLEISSINNQSTKDKEELEIQLAIKISEVKSSFKANTVCVVPVKPEVLDPLLQDWVPPTENKCRFSGSETFLCLSNLPPDVVNDDIFMELVSKFGPVVSAFLVYHHRTDESLGLGLVEYCSREVACQARNLLHQNKGIFCDWLDYRLVTYSCLYSKCLMAQSHGISAEQLRKYFSVLEPPIYCQIVPGTNVILVEYQNAEIALSTCKMLQTAHEIDEIISKIHLANPGKSALKLREKILTDSQSKESQKADTATSVMPLLPFGHHPLTFLGHQMKLLGSLFPTPVAVPSTSKMLPSIALASSPKSLRNCLPNFKSSPCVTNAFGFDLPCSPILQAKNKELHHLRSSFLPGPTNAFGFSLPCSPILKILGNESVATDFLQEKNIVEMENNILATPPSWKNFRLMSLSITPDQPVKTESKPDPLEYTDPCTPKKTGSSPSSSESESEFAEVQDLTSKLTPLRPLEVQTKRQGKRLLDCCKDEDLTSPEKEKLDSGSSLKKRLILGQLDDNKAGVSWTLDSTWKKSNHNTHNKENTSVILYTDIKSENDI